MRTRGTNASDRSDIFFLQSTNGGANWGTTTNGGASWTTKALRVNADGAGTNDQWMPTMIVKPEGNQLFIGWYDRRGDTNSSLIDAYGRWGTIATNGAVTFSTNDFRITTQSFPPTFPGTSLVNTNKGSCDPVWPPPDVALDWWYPEWWYIDPQTGPDRTLSSYEHEAGEHHGAYASMECVYYVWSDNRVYWTYRGSNTHVQGISRHQADVRLARLLWPEQ